MQRTRMMLLLAWLSSSTLAPIWAQSPPPSPSGSSSAGTVGMRPARGFLPLHGRLTSRGAMSGRVCDSQGQPLRGRLVELQSGSQVVDRAVSDGAGRFQLQAGRTGSYTLVIDSISLPCQCWDFRIAPPAAQETVTFHVPEPMIVRGQRPIAELLTSPLLIGGIIAAAVAIPIAVHNASDGS